MAQFPRGMLLDLNPTWIGEWSHNMDMVLFLVSFSGFPYPAWCTDATKISTWSDRNSCTLSEFRIRIHVHVNTLINNYMKRFLPYAVYRMPYTGCRMLVNATEVQ